MEVCGIWVETVKVLGKMLKFHPKLEMVVFQ